MSLLELLCKKQTSLNEELKQDATPIDTLQLQLEETLTRRAEIETSLTTARQKASEIEHSMQELQKKHAKKIKEIEKECNEIIKMLEIYESSQTQH